MTEPEYVSPLDNSSIAVSGWFGESEGWAIEPIPVPWYDRVRHPIFYGRMWASRVKESVQYRLRKWGGADDCC